MHTISIRTFKILILKPPSYFSMIEIFIACVGVNVKPSCIAGCPVANFTNAYHAGWAPCTGRFIGIGILLSRFLVLRVDRLGCPSAVHLFWQSRHCRSWSVAVKLINAQSWFIEREACMVRVALVALAIFLKTRRRCQEFDRTDKKKA